MFVVFIGTTGIVISGLGLLYIGSMRSNAALLGLDVMYGDGASEGYTYIGSRPFVISGLVISEVFLSNFFLNWEIITSGICGEISSILCDSSRTTFSISLAAIRSERDNANSTKIKRYIFL